MKTFNPNSNNQPQNNHYEEIKRGFLNDLRGIIIGSVLAPISLFAGVVTMAVLILIAFGQVNYWGTTGKILVGFFVPLIIVLCIVSRPIGNLIFIIWSFLLFLVVVGSPMCAILYMCFKPVFEYLGFNF